MPPAPASIAAAPSPRSSVPWNPAVPPPPVTGAALGNWVAVEVAVTVWVTVAVAVWGAGAVAVEVTPGVPVAVVVPDADVWPGDVVLPEDAGAVRDTVAVVVTDGVKTVGVDVDEDEVQAETATGASRIRAHQQRAVSLAASGLPAIVPRTFMDPPFCTGQMTTVFPGPGARNRYRKETRDRCGRRPRRHRQVPKAPTAIKGMAGVPRRRAMACSS